MWGCLEKVLLRLKSTFDEAFIGYAENGLVEVDSIIETKNVDFFENIFPWKTNSQQQVQRNLRIESSDPFEPELGRSKRERKRINLGDDFYTFLVDDNPRSYKRVMTSSDAPLCKVAISGEIESITHNHNWEIVDLPHDAKTIGCKWIFKRKLKPYGSIEKYKAHLVDKGFKQNKGVDYFDTFAHVIRISSIRVLIDLALVHNLVIHRMDANSTFLDGELEEEIYMDQPEGCMVPREEQKVCRQVKSLYGLK